MAFARSKCDRTGDQSVQGRGKYVLCLLALAFSIKERKADVRIANENRIDRGGLAEGLGEPRGINRTGLLR